jgi:hypothetical protein
MAGVADAAREALTPYVGSTAADTCIRATALSLGKTSSDLSSEDVPALSRQLRDLLGPVAPPGTIDVVIARFEESVE